jgi:hypothetical protein
MLVTFSVTSTWNSSNNSKLHNTSDMNNFSNNLTSTFNGSTPGAGSATQCRTPCNSFKPSQSSRFLLLSVQTSFILLAKCPNSRIKQFWKIIPVDGYLKFRSLQRIIFSSDFDNIIRTITVDNICAFYGECIPSNGREYVMLLYKRWNR